MSAKADMEALAALAGGDLAELLAGDDDSGSAIPYNYWRVVTESDDGTSIDSDQVVRGDQRDEQKAMAHVGIAGVTGDPIGFGRRQAFEAMRRQHLTDWQWSEWDRRTVMAKPTSGPPAVPTPAGTAD
jgi:hypothetical protein